MICKSYAQGFVPQKSKKSESGNIVYKGVGRRDSRSITLQV